MLGKSFIALAALCNAAALWHAADGRGGQAIFDYVCSLIWLGIGAFLINEDRKNDV